MAAERESQNPGRGAKTAEPHESVTPESARWVVFLNQDGLLIAATVRALAKIGLIDRSLDTEAYLEDILPEIRQRGFGYLRVGLRCLASQGWLEEQASLCPGSTTIRWTEAGRRATSYFDRYVRVGDFLATFASNDEDSWRSPWSVDQIRKLDSLLEPFGNRWGIHPAIPDEERALLKAHLDAGVLVPVALAIRAVDGGESHTIPRGRAGDAMATVLAIVGWLDAETRQWTDKGRRNMELAEHFGMAASYLPLLARLPELFLGRTLALSHASKNTEWHVNRPLNVNASAVAHRRYFTDADAIFTRIFDQEPLQSQPRFIADIGCGDGSWLVHLYNLIADATLRGRHLDTHPLVMVGMDLNSAALAEARQVLEAAGVPAILATGDIGDPATINKTLKKHDLTMAEGLHVRAFIDHNRSYRGTDESVEVSGASTGAYVDGEGRPLSPVEVERDLIAHLERWVPHVHKHGLVMLEAHSVPPSVASRHLGTTHSVAFDAYHGYSHQYPIEHSAFLDAAKRAGLQPASDDERRYPSSRPFVAVSLNRFVVPTKGVQLPGDASVTERADTWAPDPALDLEDGEALHRLLFANGDLRHPRSWCSAATGFVVAETLLAIESRLRRARRGDVIRILDYGAGTGLATIELLKACHQRGLDKRLNDIGAAVEVHLTDIPSSWFAQGFALLRSSSWTRFHSLRSADGEFRVLSEVTGGASIDVIMANMVFHLIPPKQLPRVAQELAGVLRPNGRLVWSSPDLGPAGAYAVLFHDANRQFRREWLALVGRGGDSVSAVVDRALATARQLDKANRDRAQRRADRRILPLAHDADDVVKALRAHFTGTTELPTHEILIDDLVDTLMVPSNQAEFVAEIDDRPLREAVIQELMLERVIPAMQAGPAGTGAGLNVQWTLGSLALRAD